MVVACNCHEQNNKRIENETFLSLPRAARSENRRRCKAVWLGGSIVLLLHVLLWKHLLTVFFCSNTSIYVYITETSYLAYI